MGHRGTLAVAGITVRSVRLADVGPDGGALLDPAERARAARITDPPARLDFVAGRIALRGFAAGILSVRPGELTADYSCPDCGTGPELDHGRPGYRLDGAPTGLSLSLSRSRGWALLAAGRGVGPGSAGSTIGIDLEHSSGTVFPGFDDVALTPAERQLLTELPPDQADHWRTAVWARKEALLKARGTGLRLDPCSVEAFPEPADGNVLFELDTPALGLPAGFAAALAVVGTA
ncbi:4'-phosphopantetheinyl transferase family protein [Arthrobacter sp. TB 26]|uniref:4'-phosphopantetheinyl transferase family protein n=1 Tax=Arthrobacter sp. TB 26 TaxID=494420 RepID=UPI000425BC4B|nr:4'-phosphopantetheinyl transferase superfamily protein [Arthrobacter sp. TB 26]